MTNVNIADTTRLLVEAVDRYKRLGISNLPPPNLHDGGALDTIRQNVETILDREEGQNYLLQHFQCVYTGIKLQEDIFRACNTFKQNYLSYLDAEEVEWNNEINASGTVEKSPLYQQFNVDFVPVAHKKRRGNLPKESTDVLKNWLIAHLDHPYPTETEKEDLCKQTKLTSNQISNWFINARRRQVPKLRAQDNNNNNTPAPRGNTQAPQPKSNTQQFM
mmetsp:Transcript_3638/g.4025  ORF Transcript_3638/g.4025 Transcript_3638/m.4025 type:complete len:219 (+) Transcript_3638:52-708(+)